MTNACLEGFNGTIFCYGQTGSGKTFTTFGPPDDHLDNGNGAGGGGGGDGEDNDNKADENGGRGMTAGESRGLVPRVLQYLFERFSASSQQQQEVMMIGELAFVLGTGIRDFSGGLGYDMSLGKQPSITLRQSPFTFSPRLLFPDS